MGNNSCGKLGLGESADKFSYTKIPMLIEELKQIAKVACGMSHSLALAHDGSVFSWGQNKYGALGLGPNQANVCIPMQIKSLANYTVTDISAGCRHSILLTASSVFACGDAM
jgi:alpha-tubulin suppressor-like RCC1 family protein